MKTENKEKIAVLTKDSFTICGKELAPPFTVEQVTNLLGPARLHENHVSGINECTREYESYTIRILVWDELGLQGWPNESLTEIKAFALFFAPHSWNKPKQLFGGVFKIGDKEYREAKWKKDRDSEGNHCKLGNFTVSTLLPSDVDEYRKWHKEEVVQYELCHVEISWSLPKVKTTKYKLKQPEEPVLVFKNFNFKLAVVEVLMYTKGLLEPKFDEYEFAKEYSRCNIDIDRDGYQPIPEIVKWFKDLPIPARLASEVEEIYMDGGSDVYHAICPFWDGEDELFDLNNVSPEEIRQFPLLKKITLLTGKYKKIAKIFEAEGIETESI